MRIVDRNGTRPATLTEMRVSRLDHAPGTPIACVVLEGTAGLSRSMTVVLPLSDAAPLARALTSTDADCTAACNLILGPARRLESAVVHAVIDNGPDGISAELALGCHDDPFLLACDVADALTLAVRAQAPIYATRRALERSLGNGHRSSSDGLTSGR
jgi:hypothetical protein